MIDTDREVAEPIAPRPPSLRARLTVAVLGPDERSQLRRFVPYFPEFNLKPGRKPIPTALFLAASVAIACGVVLPPVFVLHQLSAGTRQAIAQTQAESVRRKLAIERYKLVQGHLQRIESERRALEQVISGGTRWSHVLDQLRAQLPPGVKITRLEADASGSVKLSGESFDLRSLGSFMLFLRASGNFVKPQLDMTQRITGVGPEIYAFSMTVERAATASDSLLAGASVLASTASAVPAAFNRTVQPASQARTGHEASPVTPAATGLEANRIENQKAEKELLGN